MKHIHDRKIIHRDIKAQNIFLMASDNSIRLGDFGVARILDYTAAQAKTQVGTPYYIAPEILKGRAYTHKADIWSMGILLYELCALDVPIKAANLHDLYKRIMSFSRVPALPRQYSKNMKDLIESMLNVDASKRPSVNDLLDHPTIKPRIGRLLSEEEKKEEFDHTVLHNEHILKDKGKAQVPPKAPGVVGSSNQARPYSARSGQSNRGQVEEAKRPSPSPAVGLKAQGLGAGRAAPRLADRSKEGKIVNSGSKEVDRSVRDKYKNPQIQPGRMGMGARKNSEGLLHAHKLIPGLKGVKESPRNNGAKFSYEKPSPSQTPRVNGAKKLGAENVVGFQKQRPSSAAYGMYKGAANQKAKPLGNNNGRIFK